MSAVLRWTVVLGHDREPPVVVQLVPVLVGLTGLAIHYTVPVRTPALLEKASPPALEEKMDRVRCLLGRRFGLPCLREPQVRSPQLWAGELGYVVAELVHDACVDSTCCKDTGATLLPRR